MSVFTAACLAVNTIVFPSFADYGNGENNTFAQSVEASDTTMRSDMSLANVKLKTASGSNAEAAATGSNSKKETGKSDASKTPDMAAKKEITETFTFMEETVEYPEQELPDNDELLNGYVQQFLYGSDFGISLFGNYGEAKLSERDKKIYKLLKAEIEKIAKGEKSGTGIEIVNPDTTKGTWTSTTSGDLTEEDKNLIQTHPAINTELILDCLLVDCPYSLYWFDKTKGMSTEIQMEASKTGTTLTGRVSKWTFKFVVAEEYQDGSKYKVKTISDLGTTLAAVKRNAEKIVTANKAKSDYKKLSAYKKEICDRVSYDSAAAANPSMAYGSPWQMLDVFSGKTDVKVVCEGYAKAFQYLCDLTCGVADDPLGSTEGLSRFSDTALSCYTVTGTMKKDDGTAENHMWNIVSTGGKNYLVDVTNCDLETIGAPDKLFMVGGTKTGEGQYKVTIGTNTITYTFDNTTKELYGNSLELSASDYSYTAAPGLTLTTDKSTSFYGDEIEVSAILVDPSGESEGSVQFYLDGLVDSQRLGDPQSVSGAKATIRLDKNSLKAGDHTIYAKYTGSAIATGKEANTSIHVLKRALKVEAGSFKLQKVYDGTTAVPSDAESGSLKVTSDGAEGILTGDVVSVDISRPLPAFPTENVGTAEVQVEVSLSGADSGNYCLEGNAASVKVYIPYTVKAKTINTVTVDVNGSYTYTGSQITPAAGNGLSVKKDGIEMPTGSYLVAYENNRNAGTASLTVSAASDSNENWTPIRKEFIIAPAVLTVTAKPNTIVYGEQPQGAGVTYSGFLGTDKVSDLKGRISYKFNYKQYDKVGSYSITPSGLTGSNYDIQYKPAVLTVTAAELTVTADSFSIKVGAPKPSYTAAVTGLQGTDTMSGIMFKDTAADTSKNGVYTITPYGGTVSGGNENYTILYKNGELTITLTDALIDAAIQDARKAKEGVIASDKAPKRVDKGTRFVPTLTMRTLEAAITKAEKAKTTAKTDAEVVEAAKELNEKTAEFRSQIRVGTYTGSSSGGSSSGGSSGGSGGSSSGGSSSGGSSSGGSSGKVISTSGGPNKTSEPKAEDPGTFSSDPVKGLVNSINGIITKPVSGQNGVGRSNWQKDDKNAAGGWRFRYANGSLAAGTMVKDAAGAMQEQVLWEKINGAWYAFGADALLKSGWVWDHGAAKWYYIDADSGMKMGWFQNAGDGRWYYLNPSGGYMKTGWQLISGKWYYFNQDSTKGAAGSMLQGQKSPDGYNLSAEGAWDGTK